MARNMNLPHVSIPNGSGEQPDEQPERRRPTAFGANMDTGRMTQYFSDGSQETRYNDTPAEQMFEQMGQVIQRGKAARQQKRQLDDAALASALVYSKQNNGFMPPDITNAISAQLGLPIAGGNFAENGDYIIYGRKQLRSANGKVSGEQIVPLAIANPEMQFRVLQRSGLGQSMQEELYDGMRAKMKLTDQQLADRGILDPRLAFAQNPANAKNARALMSGKGQGQGEDQTGPNATEILKDVSAMQKYMTDNAATMDDATREQMGTALGNAMKMLTSRYLPKAVDGGDAQTQQTAVPQVSEDGSMMKLMDGRTIRKDQEFEVEGPNGQKMKLIWRGGDAKNVEKIG